MAGGRPTKYKEEYCDLADEYIAECIDEETTFHKTMGEKSNSYDRILKVNLPTHEGFAIYINVVPSTLYEWANKHPSFSKALDKIKNEQKKRLLNKGVSGEYNSTIAKLILSSNHGMAEKSETVSKTEVTVSEKVKDKIDSILDDSTTED